jgi:DNA/RNA endonuclease YhcR with UshA esterase domain
MRPIFFFGLFVVLSLAASSTCQQIKRVPAAQAAQHVGERTTVCGIVASTKYLSSSRSKPTFLNIGKPYPDEDFTVVIWPEDRAKFGHPEDTMLNKNICVTGLIELYKGKPEIIARSANQIAIN